MTKFLEAVAQYYLDSSADLGRLVLIVPNKRSGLYLRYYLKMKAKKPVAMPRIKTLASYIQTLAGGELTEATRLEQLFTLYKAHTAVRLESGIDIRPFDQFTFWGEIMLDDFNDIDSNLADPEAVLKNVSDFREIESDYLNEEQIEVAREVWGYDLKAHGAGFWKHIRHGKEMDDSFITLWKILIPTYHRFLDDLNDRGLSTRGQLARMAAMKTSEEIPDGLGIERIGFVGFNVLSGAEMKIFRNFQRSGIADFFWDEPLSLSRDLPDDSSDFIPLKNYIRRIKKEFPEPADYHRPSPVPAPDVTIMAVPSNSMQAKLTGRLLEKLLDTGEADRERPDSVAVVLPAPGVLSTLLHSLPSLQKMSLNITMGLPIRHTPFATFLNALVRMYLRSSISKQSVTFITEDVARVLDHPSILMLGSDDVINVKRYMAENRHIIITVDELHQVAGSLSFLFSDKVMREQTVDSVGNLFLGIVDGLSERLQPLIERQEKNMTPAQKAHIHELLLLRAYREAILTIIETTVRFSQFPELSDLALDTGTFIILLERLIRRETLNMSGSPMRGVQIMGPLETRSLDFDNIIMLTTNEHTFPKRTFFKSLIPHSIRVGYGLTTVEHSELQYSWIFYNLISRSKRATFMFDARDKKVGSNEMSRYLFQLRHIFTELKTKTVNVQPVALKTENDEIVIEKNDEVRKEVRRFLSGGDRRLSASSIRDYLKCPLRFYLRHIKKMSEDVAPSDFIDSSTIGTLVHATFENFYASLKGKLIEPKVIGSRIDPRGIRLTVASLMDRTYFKGRYADNPNLMPGEAGLLVEVLSDKIIDVLKTESRLRNERFTYIAGEQRPETEDGTVDWTLTPDLSIRFTYSIDRIDRLEDGTLRFIDYKTGGDQTSVGSIDELFGTDDKEPVGAVFQLLAYAYVYAATHPDVKDIKPEILKIFDAEKSITTPLSIKPPAGSSDKKILIYSHRDIEDFPERLAQRLAPLFDDDTPFRQTPNEMNCKYCQFSDVCGRSTNEE